MYAFAETVVDNNCTGCSWGQAIFYDERSLLSSSKSYRLQHILSIFTTHNSHWQKLPSPTYFIYINHSQHPFPVLVEKIRSEKNNYYCNVEKRAKGCW